MLLKTAAVPGKSILGVQSCLPCNGFFLSPSCGTGSLGLFGFSFTLVRLPGVNACGDKLLGKEAVSLVDFFGNLAAYIGQMEKMIFVHSEKAAVPQGSHCIAQGICHD